jgi:hypothetical protein
VPRALHRAAGAGTAVASSCATRGGGCYIRDRNVEMAWFPFHVRNKVRRVRAWAWVELCVTSF